MSDDVAQLAERCEQATGPNRELDATIWWLAGPGKADWPSVPEYVDPVAACGAVWGRKPFTNPPTWDSVGYRGPNFTASIDAAMTLVPEGWKLRQMHFNAPCADDRKWNVQLHGGREGEDCFTAFAATRELALCAAALRARATPPRRD